MPRILCALVAFVGLLVWCASPHAQDTREQWLSPKDGDGSDANPYHARCLGMADAGAIDLTPSGVDMFWCASAALPADTTGVIQIGSSLSSALGARKGTLASALKRPLTANTVNDLLIEFISPRLRPGKDGKLKIYLGRQTPEYQQTAGIPFRDNGVVADIRNYAADLLEPAIAWATTLAIETFPTNGNLNGSTQVHGWTEFFGTALDVSSNKARGLGNATVEARADVDLATDDMEVYATITGAVTGGSEIRIGVIGRKDSTTTRDFYAAHGVYSAAAEYRLIKRVAGASTTLGTHANDPVDGDVVKLRSDGSSHSLYVNGVELVTPVTDTAITGNTRAGIMYIGANASDVGTLDDWQAYDYPLPSTRQRGGAIWFN